MEIEPDEGVAVDFVKHDGFFLKRKSQELYSPSGIYLGIWYLKT